MCEFPDPRDNMPGDGRHHRLAGALGVLMESAFSSLAICKSTLVSGTSGFIYRFMFVSAKYLPSPPLPLAILQTKARWGAPLKDAT